MAAVGSLYELIPPASRSRRFDPEGLRAKGVPYMIIGGMANAVWGMPRATFFSGGPCERFQCLFSGVPADEINKWARDSSLVIDGN